MGTEPEKDPDDRAAAPPSPTKIDEAIAKFFAVDPPVRDNYRPRVRRP
jgi:hypothetical protein